jgi:hypothetical protein
MEEFVPARSQDFTHCVRTQPVGLTDVGFDVDVGVFHDVGSFVCEVSLLGTHSHDNKGVAAQQTIKSQPTDN